MLIKRMKLFTGIGIMAAGLLAAGVIASAEETQESLSDLFYTYTNDNVVSEYYDQNYIYLNRELENKAYDGFLALDDLDLDYDGTDELLAIRLKPQTDDAGETENSLVAEVYERNENSLQRVASYTLAEDFLTLGESRTDVFLTYAQNGVWICCESKERAVMLADGINWSLRCGYFNGTDFTEITNVSLSGSSFTDEQMTNAANAVSSLGMDVSDPVWTPLMEQWTTFDRVCLIYRYMTVDNSEVQQFLDNQTAESYQYGETRFKNYVNEDVENKMPKEFGTVIKEAQSSDGTQTGYSYEGDYVIADSNSRYITEEELAALSETELLIARNEIYARHGRIFNNEALNAYFNSKSWYQPTVSGTEFTEDYASQVFNDFEKANISTIVKYEQAHGLNDF